MYEQMNLFTMMMPTVETKATWCYDNTIVEASKPKPWMNRLVPDGEYVVDVGGHPLVLKPTKLKVDGIAQGHQFYHYLIDGRVYSGIFVGAEKE